MNSEKCATNMTGWLVSRDGDFYDAFLKSCLTREEYKQYSSSCHGARSQDDKTMPSMEQCSVTSDEFRALIISEILDLEDDEKDKEESTIEDEIRKVLIRIIFSCIDGCDGVVLQGYDEEKYDHMAIEFLSQWKSTIDYRPMLSVSLASARASSSVSARSRMEVIGATMDQARAFFQGNERSSSWCDTHVAIVQCSLQTLVAIERFCFHNSVEGSMIDFSGSELYVKEGVLTMPFDLETWDDGDDDYDFCDSTGGDEHPPNEREREPPDQYNDEDTSVPMSDNNDGNYEDYMSAVSRFTRKDLDHGEDYVDSDVHEETNKLLSTENKTKLFKKNKSLESTANIQAMPSKFHHQSQHGSRHRKRERGVVPVLIWRTLLLAIAFVASALFRYFSFLYHNDPYFPWRSDFKEFDLNDIAELSANKTIVITGASAGLGLSSVKLLAKAGTARLVVMGCRNMGKCERARSEVMQVIENMEESQSSRENQAENDLWNQAQTSGPTLVPLQLDLSSISSIEQFATNLQDVLWEYETFSETRTSPKLDILMNNAGIMCTTDEIQYSDETNVEMQMHVNHLGHFKLSQLLLRNLSGGGRVVSVSSLAGSFPFHFSNAASRSIGTGKDVFILPKYIRSLLENISSYGASKRANLLFTNGFNQRYADNDTNVTAVVSHPGYSRTSIMITGWSFAPSFIRTFIQKNMIGSMSPDDGALSQIRAALDVHNVKADMYVGPLFLTAGKPVIVGSSLRSFHHLFWPIGGGDHVSHDNEGGFVNTAIVGDLWKFSEESLKCGQGQHNDDL